MTERLLVDLRADGQVQVSSWPAMEAYPRAVGAPVELVWPLTDGDAADLRWYLERYLQVPTAVYGERGVRIAAQLPKWGEQVFEAVFGTRSARDAYVAARSRGGPVEIALLSESAEQLGRPWELMCVPGRGVPVVLDGVAVSRSLLGNGMKDVFAVPGSRLRVLMVISRPGGTADVRYQMIARPLLERLEAVRGSVDLVVLRPPTLERLREVLAEAREAGEPFQVVHFDGHGVFGNTSAGSAGGAGSSWVSAMYQTAGPQGMLAFEQPGGGMHLVPASDVARALSTAKVPVVVLNACQSAQLETRVGAQVEAAVATRLVAEGCACVVAMAYSVYAVAAAEFMTAFYERLFAGDRVADAVTRGRAQLALNDGRPSMKGMLPLADWMVPVVYARSDVRFPGLRTTRDRGEALGDILARIRRQPGPSDHAWRGIGGDGELAAVGEFVGRDAAFYTLDVAARLQHTVVVHGPGGTGKTELAKAFGRWWRDTGGVDDPDWVIWHSFEPGVGSFGLDGVLTTIGLAVFGTRFAALEPSERQAAVEEVVATRRLLLLWDNFESVREMPDPGRATPPLSEAEQDRIRAFLVRIAGGGTSAVVITSRTPETWLGPGVRRIELGGLSPEEATAYAEQLLAPYPGARSRRQAPAFADLMRWLDGHPLSMRLVLPHLDAVPAQDLLAGLQGATALPTSDGTGDRRTSLRACIAYSFRHLAPEDQRALTVLSLFHGVADIGVLKVFSDDPQAPERFHGRTAQDWAELLGRAAATGLLTPLGTALFRLHPALPSHLAAHWSAQAPDTHGEESTAAVGALICAHAALGVWLIEQLRGGDAPLALAMISRQQRMLGAMLGQALERGRWSDALSMIEPLDDYWDARGLAEEGRAWCDRIRLAVESPDGSAPALDTPAGALWLFATGAQANRERLAGQLDRAENTYQTILHALQRLPDSDRHRLHLANVYHQLGMLASNRGRLEEAEDWYRRSLAIKEDLDNRPSIASTYHQLGVLAYLRGLLGDAERWYRRSLAISEDLGNRPSMASSYHQLGTIAENRGQLREAEDWYRQSLAISEDLGDRPSMATTYHQLGSIAQRWRRLEEAEDWYRRSLAIKEDLDNRPSIASTYLQLGSLAEERGQLEDAENWYHRSLTIKEDLGDRQGIAAAYHQLGNIAERRGLMEEAEDWYHRSLAIREEIGDRQGTAATYHGLGTLAMKRGRLEEADSRYHQSLAINQGLDNRPDMALTYAQMALLAAEREAVAQTLTWAIRCVSLFEEIPHPSTGSGPAHLHHLTAQLGIETVEYAWQTVTGNPLPAAVRAYVLTEPTAGD